MRVASDTEPEPTASQPKRGDPFALPPDFLTLAPKERREITWRLARTRRHRESVAEAIRHASEDGEPAVIPALTVALEADPDTLVKRHAAYGLACIADQAVVPPLRGALPSADRATKGHAILALGRLHVRDAVPDLARLLDDRYARMLVADALAEIGDERALAPLSRAAARGSPLRRLRLRKRVSTLETALGDRAPT